MKTAIQSYSPLDSDPSVTRFTSESDVTGDDSERGLSSELRDATIMLVDDDPTILEVVQLYLEDAGFTRFVTATESSTVPQLLLETHPDVVLLDLFMPELSGFDILAGMRAEPSLAHIPVIVLTSSTDSAVKLRSLKLGATDFLSKPLDSSELIARLRNTLAAKAYQDHLAYYDELMNLPNRRLFVQHVDRALGACVDDGNGCAILHIGLDRFRQLNDTLGHAAGDTLLKLVARRLQQCIGRWSPDESKASGSIRSLARIGGDEFGVLMTDIAETDSVTAVARMFLEAFGPPFLLKSEEFFLSVSIGVAAYPEDAGDRDALLKNADIATTHAKHRGRNQYQFYADDINARSTRRLELEHQLRYALERDELRLHYQPKLDVKSGEVIGAEALLRWQHPTLGAVAPTDFVPIAEETGLIVPMGEWVVREACRQCREWQEEGQPNFCVAVNVSSRQFHDKGIVQSVREALADSQLRGECLTLELTESLVMSNPRDSIKALYELKALGVGLSIDDFGTGYSSLSYLKRFPLDELKIDAAFMSDLSADGNDQAIVTAIVAMSHGLDLTVTAEGVDEEGQLAFLWELGCDAYQGALFSMPVPPDLLTLWLAGAVEHPRLRRN